MEAILNQPSDEEERPLRYLPFTSQIDRNFWHKLSAKKLDDLKLSEEPVKFHAEFDINLNISRAIASVGYGAFQEDHVPHLSLPGVLFNRNNTESFARCDKMGLLQDSVQKMIEAIVSGAALRRPSDYLCPMILLSFADLKKFHFLYWCAFPALGLPEKIKFTQIGDTRPINEIGLSQAQIVKIADVCQHKTYVLLDKMTLEELPMEEVATRHSSDVYVVFADPSGDPTYPGWTLRGLALMIAYYMPANRGDTAEGGRNDSGVYSVISLRGSRLHNFNKSHLLRIRLQKVTFDADFMSTAKFVGWEDNDRHEKRPRHLNLSASMDPKMLAASAVDLNLKLMRWRLVPDLNLEKISAIRCLILGSGTLGCNVARCLLGWGVRRLTFVDSGNVSYSNPVRQSLFTFDDSLKGGRPKAEAAADSCRRIFPGVEANHVQMKIAMPGHGSASAEYRNEVFVGVRQLEQLIEDHDAIFLLLDTREARWLPTLLGAAKKKIVINAALGFDTLLVMRHGVLKSNGLGCYFCNDVVAPTNSTRDRTLDQQCTVSRPGVSLMAAGLAAELLAGLVSHPQGNDAPAYHEFDDMDAAGAPSTSAPMATTSESPDAAALGPVPHQIRYFFSRFHLMTPSSPAFSMCPACSPKVTSAYLQDGFDFIYCAVTEDGFLEKFTGLADLQEMSENIDIIALNDSDSESSISVPA